ncbi:hypothetical protein ACXHXG_07580 [Rhizobium sp. LEGMi198b]
MPAKEKPARGPAGVAHSNDRGSLLAPEKKLHVAMALQYGCEGNQSANIIGADAVAKRRWAECDSRCSPGEDMTEEGHGLMTACGVVSFPQANTLFHLGWVVKAADQLY